MASAEAPQDPVSQFEASMKELEALVVQLEQGELGLDASLKVFERGMQLSQQCRTALDHATQRVETLIERADPSRE